MGVKSSKCDSYIFTVKSSTLRKIHIPMLLSPLFPPSAASVVRRERFKALRLRSKTHDCPNTEVPHYLFGSGAYSGPPHPFPLLD